MASLTTKQEKFVQGLIAGLSQRQAYYQAYPNSKKWKPGTVDNKASELFKQNETLGRYNDLLNEHKEKALWTREKADEKLKWLLAQAEEEINNSGLDATAVKAFMDAVKERNAINDIYPADKHEIDGGLSHDIIISIGSDKYGD